MSSPIFNGPQDNFILELASETYAGTNKLNTYISNFNFSDKDVMKYSGHSKDSIITKMGCRAWQWHNVDIDDCEFGDLLKENEVKLGGEIKF